MTLPVSPPPILETAGVEPERALGVLQDALSGADDGELFLERSESESLLFDDGRLKSAAYDATEGVGLRVVSGETANPTSPTPSSSTGVALGEKTPNPSTS